MLPRDTVSLIARAPQRGFGLPAIAISLGLHGAAFAGLLLFQEVAPPKPHAVFAVDLVRAADLTRPPRGNAGEQAELPKATQEIAPADAENVADPEKPAHRAAGDGEPAASEALNPGDSLAVERGSKPTPHLSTLATPENASHGRDRVPPTRQDTSPIAETASVPEESTEGSRSILLDPGRNLSPLDPAASPDTSKSRVDAELAPVKEMSHRSGEREPPREVVRSPPDRLTAHSQQPPVLNVRKVRGVAALLANVPGEDFVEKIDSSARMPSWHAGRGLVNAPPRYPYLARRRGQEGRAVLRVTVTPNGEAAFVRLHESSGYRLLDEAAVKAVREWHFIPAKRRGVPVAGSVDVPISFKLTD